MHIWRADSGTVILRIPGMQVQLCNQNYLKFFFPCLPVILETNKLKIQNVRCLGKHIDALLDINLFLKMCYNLERECESVQEAKFLIFLCTYKWTWLDFFYTKERQQGLFFTIKNDLFFLTYINSTCCLENSSPSIYVEYITWNFKRYIRENKFRNQITLVENCHKANMRYFLSVLHKTTLYQVDLQSIKT